MSQSVSPDEVYAALIELYGPLERQGPGDAGFSLKILGGLPALPAAPRIADLGCGAGAGALLLAEHLGAVVTAVDRSRVFLAQLEARARARGLADRVRVVEADMGALDWPHASLDLLWSEGAAYHLTFAGALQRWRPLLAPGGVAVISELSWWSAEPAAPVREFFAAAYPTMASEATNREHATAAGFVVRDVHRLPATAWWTNYYDPLLRRVEDVRPSAGAAMQAVLAEVDQEIALFRRFSADYGYTFYVLRPA